MILPPTEWVAHTEHPDLRSHDEIAIDLETRDPDLKKKGSGAVIGNGEVVGIAVAVANASWYFPIAHATGPNSDRKKTLEWFKDILECPATKIFHNAMYDVCWIKSLGLKINGLIIDTMIACSLLDENRFSYTLNTLSWHHLNKGKNEKALNEAAKSRGLDPKADMWRLPAMEVGAYAEKDAELTFELWQKLKKLIIEEDLQKIFNLETDLFPCLVEMRFLGVRVDVERAHELKRQLELQEEMLLHKIKRETSIDIQIWAARSVEKVFQYLKLPYSRTEKSDSPSFTKNFLSNHSHPIIKMIAEARKINKINTTFIDTILDYEYAGRIHAEINQIRSDDGGTITGRFSYSNPNLQQIPARDPDLGPQIRSLFIPERKHLWGCFDYSQQEPRLVAHYALKFKLASVNPIADSYDTDPSTDFHKIVADMAEIPRSQAKTINLGLFYGMGKAKLQAELGVTKEKANELFDKYHSKVPFVKQLMNKLMNAAQDKGKIKTLLGRRCRFPKYEPILRGDDWGKYVPAEDHERMLELQEMGEYLLDEEGNIKKDKNDKPLKNYWHQTGSRRAFTYKSLNKLIQGSAADMTKKAMLDLYKEGIIPHIQVHDELDISIRDKEHGKEIKKIMEEAVQLEVPNKVDDESGENWGSIK
jgi:DNA polymerase I-like protein with 3'-5' exonuclease and polymerase domains|tara:strand:+ start:714 stop:2651 length:1938 start_codon:yes stop_codon:yes gene_type:complete